MHEIIKSPQVVKGVSANYLHKHTAHVIAYLTHSLNKYLSFRDLCIFLCLPNLAVYKI
jgi:hypothetical protein